MKLSEHAIAVYSPTTRRLYLCDVTTGAQVSLTGRIAKTVYRRLQGKRGLRPVDATELRDAGLVR